MQYVIHKLKWQITAPTQKEALAAQNAAADLSRSEQFLAALENWLQQLDVAQEHIVIDKLEIDFGRIASVEFEENFSRMLPHILEKAREEVLQTPASKMARTPLLPKQLQEFVAFVNLGILPASLPAGQRTFTEVAGWLAQQLKALPELGESLKQVLKTDHQFAAKLAQLAPEAFLKALQINSAVRQHWVEKLLEMEKVLSREGQILAREKATLRLLLWQVLLADDFSAESLKATASATLAQAAKRLSPSSRQQMLKVVGKTFAGADSSKTIAVWPQEQKEIERYPHHKVSSEGLGVANAGLVLVAPFLPSFFKAMQILEDKNITNHGLAMALLAEMDAGALSTQNADQLLYKVVLGLPIHSEAVDILELNDAHRNEVNLLLQSLISHWQALKNTSPDGLRSGFFWRQGVLRETPDGYQLKVETRSIDVLLGSLPWGIGLIKLPWMDQPLHVEWT